MTKDEALTLALEALERLALPKNADDIFRRATVAAKEALAQPEMRPTTREEKIVRPGVYERLGERYFCQRCGKRLAELTAIHTCTPPTVTGYEY